MSFLYDRLVANIDKATTDPKIEAEITAKKEKLKGLIATNQKFIDTQKKFLFDKSPKTINDPYVIAYEDIGLLKGILDELDELNKKATDIDTLTDKTQEIIGRYNSLARNSFTHGIAWSDNIDMKGNASRFNYHTYINCLRQALHDYPDMTGEYKTAALAVIPALKEVLKNNLYTNDHSYNEEIQNINKKYDTLIQKFITGTAGKGADEWDPKTGKMMNIYTDIQKKFMVTNKLRLDFKELPTDPDVLPDIVKTKIESDALKADKELDSFSIWNVLQKALSTGLTIGLVLLVIFLAGMGASIAVNLNVYKPLAYRILYTFYGMLFSPIVLIYGLLYRGWWLGKKQVYYGFLPLIPYFFINKYTRFLLGWLTYRPDNHIWDLQEWRTYRT
jgi:hypothetical protein